jgi:hypothetical protein
MAGGAAGEGAPVDATRMRALPDVLRDRDGSVRDFYEDREFTCRDCGKEVWTATDQKLWFEEVGGSPYSGANRCAACRAAKRQPGS